MEQNISEAELLEKKITEIEKIMMELDPRTKEMHKWYLCGWIDSQYDSGKISENIRGVLYETYRP